MATIKRQLLAASMTALVNTGIQLSACLSVLRLSVCLFFCLSLSGTFLAELQTRLV